VHADGAEPGPQAVRCKGHGTRMRHVHRGSCPWQRLSSLTGGVILQWQLPRLPLLHSAGEGACVGVMHPQALCGEWLARHAVNRAAGQR
jgi:hypothetical protein